MDMYKTNIYDKLQVIEQAGKELDAGERLRAMNRPLLAWYEQHARILPWREEPHPYRVWISEIMLQQTRVEAVKPYFERFMAELPTPAHLAEVSEDRLMKLWEGLGYYNRARNLKKTAMILMEEHEGELPSSHEELLSLPGIGSYTAGAIASIAFGIRVPAVDGNVLRVLSRVLASKEDILKQSTKKRFEEMLKKTMPEAASHFNQGLIEIGAIVCVPNGQPKCAECPVSSLCLARKQGLISEIPVKTPKKQRRIENRTICVIENEEQVAIRKRKDQGLLASLYELPNVEGHLKIGELAESFGLREEDICEVETLPEGKHIFSHVEWHMTGFRIKLSGKLPDQYLSVERQSLKRDYPLPNAFGTYMKLIKCG